MSRFFTVATFITAAQALAFDGKPARATDAVVPDATFYRPEITEAPNVKELMKRAGDQTVLVGPDNTCGYVSGRAGAAYTCGSDYTCAFATTGSFGAVACCSGSICGLRATCLDYADVYSSSACDDGCKQDTYTAKCTDTDFPYCGTVTFFSGIRDYYCDSLSISTPQQLYTTYFGETDGRSFQAVVLTEDPFGSASDINTASDFDTTSDFDNASDVDTATDSETSLTSTAPRPTRSNTDGGSSGNNDPVQKKSSTPIGPIVGGVVGGVGALGLLGLAIFLIIRHNNKKKASTPVVEPMQQTMAAGGAPPPPPGAPSYPQQAYNAPHGQQPYQQQPTPPQGQAYYPQDEQKPAGFVSMAPTLVPDRHDSTSPVSQFSDTRYSTQPPPHSPTSTIHSNWGPQPGQPGSPHPGPPQPPPTVYEAGGNVVGERDYNSNHRGQFHEMG